MPEKDGALVLDILKRTPLLIGGLLLLTLICSTLFLQFDQCESDCARLCDLELPLPAYEQVLRASHSFNLLDARHAISVTERQRYILRVRTLSRQVAEAWVNKREALGYPLLKTDTASTAEEGVVNV